MKLALLQNLLININFKSIKISKEKPNHKKPKW